MKNTSINELRHILKLERPELTTDGYGGSERLWINVTDLWAKIEPLSTRETLLKDQVESEITHRIIIRYRTDVLPEMRLRKEGRVFEIIGVLNEMERNRWLQLECKEKQL